MNNKRIREPEASYESEEMPLSNETIHDLLTKSPGWALKGKVIERDFQFKNFREAMLFVNKVADVAEQQAHHPDILISYNKVMLTLSTHKIGGLSRKDFILAGKINVITDINREA